MLNQSIFSVTQARKRGIIRLGERLKVTLPDSTAFETEIVEPGNRFRERGLVRAFYEREKVEGSDFVVLSEVKPGEWTLKKNTRAEMVDEKFLGLEPRKDQQALNSKEKEGAE